MLPKLGPLPMKERLSVLFMEKGRLDVLDGSFVVVDKNGIRTHIPVGSVSCLMLEPGHPGEPCRREPGRQGGLSSGLGGRGWCEAVRRRPARRSPKRPPALAIRDRL